MKLNILLVILAVLLIGCGAQSVSEPAQEAQAVEETTEADASAAVETTEVELDETEASDDADASDAGDALTEIDASTAVEESAELLLAPEIESHFPEDEMTTTDSGLQYVIVEEGDGPAPKEGEVVQIDFVGWLADGTQLGSSYERGEPVGFLLGQELLMPGWDEGVALMKVGDKAKFIIPPELGFGPEGDGRVIPGNATLYFEMELVDVLTPGPADPTEVDEDDYTEMDSGLKYYDLKEGSGDESEPDQIVTVHYTGWLEDGTKFDSTVDRAQPFSFQLGGGQFIPGSDDGITAMKVGGQRQLVIPSEIAFGEQGLPGLIPPDTDLIVEVELLEILPGAPTAPTEVDEDDYTTTESGLKYYDFEEGTGDSPEEGQQVIVHYTGWLEDGTKFDSSLDRSEPFSFALGVGQVISGWDEGVATMKIGGKRQLVIPAELGYGDAGAGGTIPGGATLIFEVELLDIQ